MIESIHFMIDRRTMIHCDGCEQRIGNALRRMPGVTGVRASRHTQQVSVVFDPDQVSVEQIQARLAQAGFEAVPMRERA